MVVLLAAQVVELDLAHGVRGRRQVDYPGRHRVFEQVQQQISQEKVTLEGRKEVERRGRKRQESGGVENDELCFSTQVIDSKLRLVAVLSDAVGTHGHACVVDQEVETLLSCRRVGRVGGRNQNTSRQPSDLDWIDTFVLEHWRHPLL